MSTTSKINLDYVINECEDTTFGICALCVIPTQVACVHVREHTTTCD